MFALLLALGVVALVPAAARADGDPASDILYNGKTFLPFEVKISPQNQQDLEEVVAAAWKAGFPIKVAVISSPLELGAVGALWKKPQLYSKFLGAELAFLYKGRLLIVMPNGYGLHRGTVSTVAERRVLKHVPIGQGGNGLVASATDAVLALAAASGHQLPKPVQATSNAGRDRIVIVIAVVLVGLLILIFVPGVRRRLRPGRAA
jgi:hypothetical protein